MGHITEIQYSEVQPHKLETVNNALKIWEEMISKLEFSIQPKLLSISIV